MNLKPIDKIKKSFRSIVLRPLAKEIAKELCLWTNGGLPQPKGSGKVCIIQPYDLDKDKAEQREKEEEEQKLPHQCQDIKNYQQK